MSEVTTFLIDAREDFSCKYELNEMIEYFIDSVNLTTLNIKNMISKTFCEYYSIEIPNTLEWQNKFSFNEKEFIVNGNCLTGDITVLKK